MLFWVALAIWLLLTVAGLTYAVVRAISLWRAFKRTGGALATGLDDIGRSVERIETHLSSAEAAGGRLNGATERLRDSRAELDVLLGAIREARATVSFLLPFAAPQRRH